MKRNLWVAVSLGALLFAGCSGGDAPDPGTAKQAAQNIVYSKDERTGLCYPSVSSTSYAGYNLISITNVPCSPAVEKLLVQ